MTERTIRRRLADHFARQGFQLNAGGRNGMRFVKEREAWRIAVCAEKTGEMDFLKTFDAAMQTLIDARHLSIEDREQLGLAVSFDGVLAGERPSYRRALKKYSNSIVFEDVGIALLLVSNAGVEVVEPEGVNDYLRSLDERVRAERR
jgi:hypothetical protein